MMYLGNQAVGINDKIPVYDIYQNIAIAEANDPNTITFNNVEHKPDAFIIGLMDTMENDHAGYRCTAASGIWTEYQGGQYAGGRATGRTASGVEDHWAVSATNIVYDGTAKTFTFTTGTNVRFMSGLTYRLSYYTSHRGGDT